MRAADARHLLRIGRLSAWFGEARVLRDVGLTAEPGEVVTLVGRNGAGKPTLLRCVMGLHPGPARHDRPRPAPRTRVPAGPARVGLGAG